MRPAVNAGVPGTAAADGCGRDARDPSRRGGSAAGNAHEPGLGSRPQTDAGETPAIPAGDRCGARTADAGETPAIPAGAAVLRQAMLTGRAWDRGRPGRKCLRAGRQCVLREGKSVAPGPNCSLAAGLIRRPYQPCSTQAACWLDLTRPSRFWRGCAACLRRIPSSWQRNTPATASAQRSAEA